MVGVRAQPAGYYVVPEEEAEAKKVTSYLLLLVAVVGCWPTPYRSTYPPEKREPTHDTSHQPATTHAATIRTPHTQQAAAAASSTAGSRGSVAPAVSRLLAAVHHVH